MHWSLGRDVREDPEVTEGINEAQKKWPRFDDAWAGLTWLLARQAPELGVWQMRGDTMYRLYKQAGNKLADTPDITVVYSFDDQMVYVHDMKAEPRSDGEDEVTEL